MNLNSCKPSNWTPWTRRIFIIGMWLTAIALIITAGVTGTLKDLFVLIMEAVK